MKVAKYILDSDGRIPDTVINGGMFPNINSNSPPQDYTFVGLCSDDHVGDGMSKSDLVSYVESFWSDDINSITGKEVSVSDQVSEWWDAVVSTNI